MCVEHAAFAFLQVDEERLGQLITDMEGKVSKDTSRSLFQTNLGIKLSGQHQFSLTIRREEVGVGTSHANSTFTKLLFELLPFATTGMFLVISRFLKFEFKT